MLTKEKLPDSSAYLAGKYWKVPYTDRKEEFEYTSDNAEGIQNAKKTS